ncbi:MAG TPA: VWA domain-containing protein [Gemmataceae bacterium]|nr:VWA domain-containing protein [Gemmataceae bacterium]
MLHHWFANTWAFPLLSLPPLVGLLGIFALRRRGRALARLGSQPALELLVAERGWVRLLAALLASLGLTLLIVGIAGPQWGRDWSVAAAPGRDLVVVLDLSRSMFAEQPTRLHRAQEGLIALTDTLKERGGHRVALVVFAARARVLCPLTHDYDHFREVVEDLAPDRLPSDIGPADDDPSGTRIGAGLRAAVELHDPRFAGFQDIILLSDGDDPARDGEWRLAAAQARAQGIPVHTVGVGDPDADSTIPTPDGPLADPDGAAVKTRLREGPLREIAEITEGVYIPAHTRALPLGRLFRERIESRPVRDDAEDSLPQYRQHYAWFLGGALALLSLSVVVSGFSRPRER